jgi:hypothetical protein
MAVVTDITDKNILDIKSGKPQRRIHIVVDKNRPNEPVQFKLRFNYETRQIELDTEFEPDV